MPFPEGESRPPPEGKPEREPVPYYQAARFRNERPARRAYFQAQDILFNTPDSDLSAYRFLLQQIWHVAVLGEPPPEDMAEQLQTVFARGEPTSLPPDILKLLTQRRRQLLLTPSHQSTLHPPLQQFLLLQQSHR
jgi:hypothetical protein